MYAFLTVILNLMINVGFERNIVIGYVFNELKNHFKSAINVHVYVHYFMNMCVLLKRLF